MVEGTSAGTPLSALQMAQNVPAPGVRDKRPLPILYSHAPGMPPGNHAVPCKESGRTYWTATLTQTFQSPCNSFLRGPVCWSYLAQARFSDSGGVQDTALHKVAATRIAAIARATPPRPRYRRLNLTSLRRPPLLSSPDFTSHLLNTSYQLWLNSTSLPIGSPCWICLPLIRSAFFGIPVRPTGPPQLHQHFCLNSHRTHQRSRPAGSGHKPHLLPTPWPRPGSRPPLPELFCTFTLLHSSQHISLL
ncbi:syncytin-1-like [Rhinolophus ferrumequinum]|uniref:syncytin-1-like n=1 Tax=Rhinolophus ferrumequinum TaxID=59479 RepID=UPI00140FBB49|nr:syncytin-1-like [Rhinolophus ferrumequinum]